MRCPRPSEVNDPISSHHMPDLLKRFNAIDPSATRDTLPIVPGKRDDYLRLKPHHYRPGNPATMTRVLAIRDPKPTAADRYSNSASPARSVAVLVESLPALSCRLRDTALDGRYGHLLPKPRSKLLNEELRCISRVIIDPRYRGLGLAVRLVRYALSTAQTRYTEALAVMGRVSPFFERAGMTAYERPPLPNESRALDALACVGIAPHDLAQPQDVEQRINALPTIQKRLITRELMRWYRTGGGRSLSQTPQLNDALRVAQQRLLARPIYYLHENIHDVSVPDAHSH